eukprot:gene6758-6975_t
MGEYRGDSNICKRCAVDRVAWRGLPAAMMVPLVVLLEETMAETWEAGDQGHEGTTAGAPLEMKLGTSWVNIETHRVQWWLPAMHVSAGDALRGDRPHGEGCHNTDSALHKS